MIRIWSKTHRTGVRLQARAHSQGFLLYLCLRHKQCNWIEKQIVSRRQYFHYTQTLAEFHTAVNYCLDCPLFPGSCIMFLFIYYLISIFLHSILFVSFLCISWCVCFSYSPLSSFTLIFGNQGLSYSGTVKLTQLGNIYLFGTLSKCTSYTGAKTATWSGFKPVLVGHIILIQG